MADGTTAYTRSGEFHLDADGKLLNSEGMALQPEITVPPNATSVSISKEGVVSVSLVGQSASQQIGTIELATFQNAAGMHALGGNLFAATTASGDATTGVPGTDGIGSTTQGFLEESNVSVVEEMVNMILGQRAYEANSRVIKAADEMLGQVNNLGR
jgi:flagellar basal-body rod protein FlgG